ncbi:hypothetical protein SHI21_16550 [Bacteriovorax sp. PP10]|uniref:AF1548-like C-terminal domain-containing protein n=1 Tax=Bacteriovorax antarcticus TaxID=3088717 RepID=A0ABU5VXQ6_9BACT|nr:hypothetical protein [Bacteriovorax sp. PP10]MEA9357843.1 hypothetical protein [Bacteriovorax sp. PP10]
MKIKKMQSSNVIKSNGDIERFSMRKFNKSLRRTGLDSMYCNQISKAVADKIHPGIRTKDIYNETFKLIKKTSVIAAVHYSLKKAILELGPTGFIFELFVARYFECIGYKTYVGTTLQGQFVKHEVDVVAVKNNYMVCVECKFHNMVRTKNDIKIVLYVKSRWDDLKKGPDGKYLREFYVATNTSFTGDALIYSNGIGLKLLGVNAPEDESFLDKIKKHKLYPITSLKRLKKIYCQELIREKLILCSDLLDKRAILKKIGMSDEEIRNLYTDINKLME